MKALTWVKDKEHSGCYKVKDPGTVGLPWGWALWKDDKSKRWTWYILFGLRDAPLSTGLSFKTLKAGKSFLEYFFNLFGPNGGEVKGLMQTYGDCSLPECSGAIIRRLDLNIGEVELVCCDCGCSYGEE